jgi:hypothetical protein
MGRKRPADLSWSVLANDETISAQASMRAISNLKWLFHFSVEIAVFLEQRSQQPPEFAVPGGLTALG